MIENAIERISLTHLQVPLKEPFRTLKGDLTQRDSFLVSATAADGRVGLGECAPLPTVEWRDRCWTSLRDEIVPRLIGRAINSIEDVERFLDEARPVIANARAAGESACLDLLGQLRHESMSELLGIQEDRIDGGIDVGLVIGQQPTVVDLLRAIELHLQEGYRRVKIKIRPGFDLEFVRAVRRHFGPELPLLVDGQGSYTMEDLDLMLQLDLEDLLMIEQPLAGDDLGGLATLQERLTTPICLDETVNTGRFAQEAISRGCGRIVNIKVQELGGLLASRQLHDVCRTAGIACFVGSRMELGVGRGAGLHAAVLPGCSYPTDLAPSARWFADDCIFPAIEFATPGRFDVPSRPGLGFRLDPSQVRRYQVWHEEHVAETVSRM